jgi:hypothetical protein
MGKGNKRKECIGSSKAVVAAHLQNVSSHFVPNQIVHASITKCPTTNYLIHTGS